MPQEGATTAHDRLRGDITVENQNLDDYIIIKSDGWALYHLAAMVDDHLMEITHVIRGSEWLPTFPLHVQIVRAFGWQEPEWVHLSVFLKPSGKGKMSKRDTADMMKDGFSIFLTDLRELGYLPEAVVNWIALMGWCLRRPHRVLHPARPGREVQPGSPQPLPGGDQLHQARSLQRAAHAQPGDPRPGESPHSPSSRRPATPSTSPPC